MRAGVGGSYDRSDPHNYGPAKLATCRVCAGNVWIYGTYGEFTTDNPGNSTYCHPTLYWYAFWLTTAGYILAGFLIVTICVIICVAVG